MKNNQRLRILLLAPGSNPKSVTGALIGYSMAEALARLHDVTLVVRARDEDSVREADGRFLSIESIASPFLDRIYNWIFKHAFKGDRGNLLWTALGYPIPLVFEWRVWRRFRKRLQMGDFDVALRILPIVPVMPSPLPFFMRNAQTPVVIGPLNGGVPWPKGFSQLNRQKAAPGNWIAGLRGIYRILPFTHSAYMRASAIIAGSSHTFAELSRFRAKMFYVPGENGIRASLINDRRIRGEGCDKKLELIYSGRLVPYKACDLALRGAARLLRAGKAHLTILEDGPERPRFEALVDDLQIRGSVTFLGRVSHPEAMERFRQSDILIFPSLREFGGGVIFEALALGVVPVVADHGGPGDIVRDDIGYKIQLTNENQMVEDIEAVLEFLANNRDHLEIVRQNGQSYARQELTWESKAGKLTEILLWSINAGPKPIFLPPKLP